MTIFEAERLARFIPSTITHTIRQLGNGEYVIALFDKGDIIFYIWEQNDLARIPPRRKRGTT